MIEVYSTWRMADPLHATRACLGRAPRVYLGLAATQTVLLFWLSSQRLAVLGWAVGVLVGTLGCEAAARGVLGDVTIETRGLIGRLARRSISLFYLLMSSYMLVMLGMMGGVLVELALQTSRALAADPVAAMLVRGMTLAVAGLVVAATVHLAGPVVLGVPAASLRRGLPAVRQTQAVTADFRPDRYGFLALTLFGLLAWVVALVTLAPVTLAVFGIFLGVDACLVAWTFRYLQDVCLWIQADKGPGIAEDLALVKTLLEVEE